MIDPIHVILMLILLPFGTAVLARPHGRAPGHGHPSGRGAADSSVALPPYAPVWN